MSLQNITHFSVLVIYITILLVILFKTFSNFAGNRENGAAIVTSCPEYFIDGEVNTITCLVNQSSISKAQCASSPQSVKFHLMALEGVHLDKCSTDYNATSCAQQSTPKACFCANRSGDVLTYQWNFIANKTYQGENVWCEICGLYSDTGPQQTISPNCLKIQFGESLYLPCFKIE